MKLLSALFTSTDGYIPASLHDAQHSDAVNNLNSFLANVPNSTPSQLGDTQTTQEEPPVTCSSCSVNNTERVALTQQTCGTNATSTLNHACPDSRADASMDSFHKPQPMLDPTVLGDPLVIELFAGTARVTACLKQLGLKSSVGVDKDAPKACSACLTADMTSPEGQALVWEWVKSPRLAALRAAPPCGTSSRARELEYGPPPLRSDAEPDGVTGLCGADLDRILVANCLYSFLSDIINYALSHQVICIIENPRNSLYWSTSFFQRISQHFRFVACEACAFGSRRPKKIVFAATCDGFDSLAQLCPGEACASNHPPWGPSETSATGFATSEETAYPPRVAFTLALAIARVLQKRGWKPVATSLLQNDRTHDALMQRAMAGMQRKAARMPPLVSEHCRIVTMQSDAPFKLPYQPMERIKRPWIVPQKTTCELAEIPVNSQLL